MYENYENSLEKTPTSNMYNETNNSLMATQHDCIPLICNKNKIQSLRILVKLTFPKINNFGKKEKIVQALVDTGCTQTIICKSITPEQNVVQSSKTIRTRIMSGEIMKNNLQIKNITIQLSTNCDLFGKKIFIPKIDVMDLVPVQEKLVLGLDFILNENRSLTITKDYLLISDNTQLSPLIEEFISGLREKRGETTMLKGW